MATGAFRIVCSGLISNQMNSVDKFIKKLAPVGSSLQKNWSTGITHVIVKPDENMLAQRTLKYLYGVASGVWIISFQWVSESLATNKMLPESEFEMLDTTGIAGPQRARMGFKPVFENCEFFLSPPFQEVSLDQLKDLVELSGARLVNSPGEFTLNKNFIKLIIADTTSDHDADSKYPFYSKVRLPA
ncbi:Breast cancer 1, early onset [Halocaridina rubra]|uniref:Breast cancer 1, early onset n=1 Tax=Halocaridina rubra TaxID=373956 RepID=A0AAN8XG91_HALRR